METGRPWNQGSIVGKKNRFEESRLLGCIFKVEEPASAEQR
jgi:hypothetical protein